MDAGIHTYVHINTELKDYVRLNKSESFVNFDVKHALSFVKAQVFLHVQESIFHPENLLLSEGM